MTVRPDAKSGRAKRIVRPILWVSGVAGFAVLANIKPAPDDVYVTLHVRNDSAVAHKISPCEDSICRVIAAGGDVVKPGDSFGQGITVYTHFAFQVETVGGATRCVFVQTTDIVPTTVDLSTLPSC